MAPLDVQWVRALYPDPPLTAPGPDPGLAELLAPMIGAGSLKPFYDSAAWLKVRAAVLAECHGESAWERQCSPARYEPATIVHHIYRVRRFPGLALSPWVTDPRTGRVERNLVALSHEAHELAHGRAFPKGRGRRATDGLPPERW